jgi:hypothetical protein
MNNTFKSIITPNVALAVFLGVLIVALFVANLCNPKYYNGTRTKIFISCLAGLGIVVTFMFYYGLVSIQQAQQRLDIVLMTSQISKMLTKGVIDQVQAASDKIPHFVMSLFPLLPQQEICEDEDTTANQILKFNISYKIFMLWQELLIATPFLDLDQHCYLCLFLQRASSKQLYNQWLCAKLDFNEETQTFGDLLFQYASNIKNHTNKIYIKTAKKILCDPIYKKLMMN